MKSLLIAVVLLIVMGLFAGGLLSIFGPSGPTTTDVFSVDGIMGTYFASDTELMDSATYEDGAVMTARAGLIVPNPRSQGYCAYQLNSARYAWVAMDANDILILPGRSYDVAPTGWPMEFSDTDPRNELIYDFPSDSWTGNGKGGVTFMIFSLLVGYSLRDGCSDPWEPKLEIFAADGADITPPPQPPDYVPPGIPSVSFTHNGVNGLPQEGDTIRLTYSSTAGTNPIQSYTITIDGRIQRTVTEEFFFVGVESSEDIEIIITAYDGETTSDPANITIDVGSPTEPPDPPVDYVPPGTPSLSFSHDGADEKPWVGDTVTLSYHSEPGTEMIEYYVVTWGTAGCTCVQESHEFVVASSEDLTITVAAFDGQELSGPAEILIDVGFEDEEEEEEEESAFNFMLILFYVLVEVIVFVVLFVLWRIVPIPPAFKVMLTIAALIIVPVVLFQTGVLESFL